MFEDQTVELLPARTTLQAGAGGAGGDGGAGGWGGDAVAISVAVIIINGDVDDSVITATAGDAAAVGGAGGAGGDGGNGGAGGWDND